MSSWYRKNLGKKTLKLELLAPSLQGRFEQIRFSYPWDISRVGKVLYSLQRHFHIWFLLKSSSIEDETVRKI